MGVHRSLCGTMQLYLFWSESDLEIFALTGDAVGNNLPSEFAPWSQNGDGSALYVGPDPMLETNLTRLESFNVTVFTSCELGRHARDLEVGVFIDEEQPDTVSPRVAHRLRD